LQPQVDAVWHLQQTLNEQPFAHPPEHASAYALFDLRLPNIITAANRSTASFKYNQVVLTGLSSSEWG